MIYIITLLENTLILNCYLLTQTVLLMKSEDVYEEFIEHKHFFAFSNFSKDSTFYDSQNEENDHSQNGRCTQRNSD